MMLKKNGQSSLQCDESRMIVLKSLIKYNYYITP